MPRVRLGKTRRTKWTTNLADRAAIGTAAVTETILVGVTDYAGNTNLEPGQVTYLRSRGFLTVTPTVITQGTLWWAFVRMPRDASSANCDPSAFQDMIDEDILQWGSWHYAALTSNPQHLHFPVNIKAKRRLKQDEIRFVARCTGTAGNNVLVTLNVRSLLKGEFT